jgi:anti-sigma factor RsiW
MLDRQDLDALLIGALYGELTPADSERLAQHLESHPADKVALDDMTRARQAVQDSRIFAAMAEPPQAVSALLLQEAHRRAPRSVAREPAQSEAGWFQRFVRSFAAHPAMAAATMLVLVAGVAGTLYVRNGQLGADEKVAEMDRAASPAPAAAARNDKMDPTSGAATNVDPNAAAGSSGYTAQLDETLRDTDQQRALQQTETELKPTTTAHFAKSGGMGGVTGGMGVTVHRPEPTVKDLPGDGDADDTGAQATISAGDRPEVSKPRPAPPAHAAQAPMSPPAVTVGNGAGAGGGAAAESRSATTAVATPSPPAPTPAAQPATASPPPPPTADAAPKAANSQNGPSQNQNVANAKTKDATDASVIAWADQQKANVIQLVNANKCPAAMDLVVQIQAVAPAYYEKNVANDRTVARCIAYLAEARARQADETQKRASRVNASDPSKK